jgi:non-ribosomal peptide synthetase component F
LALRSRIDEDATSGALLDSVRNTVLDAFAHGDIPFDRVVDAVVTVRDASRSPLVQAMMVLQKMPWQRDDSALQVRPSDLPSEDAQFDVTFEFWEKPQGMRVSLTYNTDLFDAGTVQRLADHLLNALAAMPGDEQLRGLVLQSEPESSAIARWSAGVPGPERTTLTELFAGQVARTPGKAALVCQDDELTYEQLDLRSSRLAQYLRSRGVGLESRVGVCLPRGIDPVVAMLAVLKAGAAFVPLDPEYPADRLAYMVTDSGMNLVLAAGETAPAVPVTDVPVVLVEDIDLTDVPATAPEVTIRPHNALHLRINRTSQRDGTAALRLPACGQGPTVRAHRRRCCLPVGHALVRREHTGDLGRSGQRRNTGDLAQPRAVHRRARRDVPPPWCHRDLADRRSVPRSGGRRRACAGRCAAVHGRW